MAAHLGESRAGACADTRGECLPNDAWHASGRPDSTPPRRPACLRREEKRTWSTFRTSRSRVNSCIGSSFCATTSPEPPDEGFKGILETENTRGDGFQVA